MNTDPSVIAKKISYKINDNKLFHDLSFCLNKGKALHICGDNGSGKSTLIRIILGITKQTKGELEISSTKGISYLGHKNAIKNYLSVEDNILLMQLPKTINTGSARGIDTMAPRTDPLLRLKALPITNKFKKMYELIIDKGNTIKLAVKFSEVPKDIRKLRTETGKPMKIQ